MRAPVGRPIGTGPVLIDEFRSHLARARHVATLPYFQTPLRKRARQHLSECADWLEQAIAYAEERDKQMRLMVERQARQLATLGTEQ